MMTRPIAPSLESPPHVAPRNRPLVARSLRWMLWLAVIGGGLRPAVAQRVSAQVQGTVHNGPGSGADGARVTAADEVRLDLAHGSIMVMLGDCQRTWTHEIRKAARAEDAGERVSLTFRTVHV